MFTAIILMCTIGGQCYTITNTHGFYATQTECQESVYQLITREDFKLMYGHMNGMTFNVTDVRCLNWDDTPT